MDKQGLVMEQKPDGGAETGSGKRGQLDLSVPQVAGSAFAAVVAAVLASKLGVYGTIIGAGLVSVIATCGGTIFQHFFRRTGEQIREVTVQVKPRALKIPVRQVPGAPEPGRRRRRSRCRGPDSPVRTGRGLPRRWGAGRDEAADAGRRRRVQR